MKFISIYETQRLVKIPSSILQSAFITWSLSIILYVTVYAVWWKGGYQRRCPIRANTFTQLEGVLILEKLDQDDGNPVTKQIWDHSDVLLSPPLNHASGSFFVLTNFVEATEWEGDCSSSPSKQNSCYAEEDCDKGTFVGNGFVTGRCIPNTLEPYSKTCEIIGNCPEATRQLPFHRQRALLEDTKNFIAIVDNDIEFPSCGPEYRRRNYYNYSTPEYRRYLQTCIFDPNSSEDKYCPRFRLGDIVEWAGGNYSQASLQGGVFILRITWNCTFDLGKTIRDCLPIYSFHNANEGWASLLNIGTSLRTVVHVDEHKRRVRQNTGILFLIQVEGEGRMFDFLTLSLTVGAGMGLFGFALQFCDGLFRLFCKLKNYVTWSWLQKYDESMKTDHTFLKNSVDEETEMIKK